MKRRDSRHTLRNKQHPAHRLLHIARACACATLCMALLPGLSLAASDGTMPKLKVRSFAPELNLALPSSLSFPQKDRSHTPLAARSLATGDLDHDGLPELVVGCGEDGRGAVVVYRGSRVAAVANALPFTEATEHAMPEPVELVAVGDFNADGHNDLVITSKGSSSLLLLAGNGEGELAEPQVRQLPGRVTDMVSGEVNRRDGLSDLALALAAAGTVDAGASVLVLESPKGAFFADGEVFPFAAPVTGLALGQLDEELTREVVVSTGSEVVIIHGRDRRLSEAWQRQLEVGKAVLDKVTLPVQTVSLVAANLEGDHRDEVAALTEDGTLHLIGRAAKGAGWQRQELASAADLEQGGVLKAAMLSTRDHAELLLSEPSGMTLLAVATAPGKQGEQPVLQRLARVDAEARPLSTLALRLDRDALDDLVVVLKGAVAPVAIRSAALTTYTVNTTDDNDDTICDITHCSLREAINAANAAPDLDTINIDVSAETYPIQPLTPLPAIVYGVTINGWHGFPKLTRAVLDGSLCQGSCSGLRIDGSKVTLDGLVIKSFPSDGVHITGNTEGLWIVGETGEEATGNEVLGNLIGVAGDATSPLPNGSIIYGSVVIDGGVQDTRIGGTAVDERNVIAHNAGEGIVFIRGTYGTARGVSIRGNSLHSNGGLGIDLDNDDATPNDPGDADHGSNGLQNYPVITGVDLRLGSVSGRLDSTPSTSFVVDLYANTVCNPSGYGEGEIYLGSTLVKTDANGIASFTISGLPLVSGQPITATATDSNGSTSELSPCLPPTPRL